MNNTQANRSASSESFLDRVRVWLGVGTLTVRSLRRCFFAALGAAIVLAFFMLPPQGKEILSLVVESGIASGRFWSLLLGAAALATVTWYTSRVLMDFHDLVDLKLRARELRAFGRRLETWLPRVLGALCILPLAFFLADVGVKTYVLNSPLLIVAAFALLAAIDAVHGCLRCRLYRWGFLSSMAFVLLSHRWVTELPYGEAFAITKLIRALFTIDQGLPFETTGFHVVTGVLAWLILDYSCVRWWRRHAARELTGRARTLAIVVPSAVTVLALAAWWMVFRNDLFENALPVVFVMLLAAVVVISFFVHRRDWFPRMVNRRSVERSVDDPKHQWRRRAFGPSVRVTLVTKLLLLAAFAVGAAVFAFVWREPVAAAKFLGAPALLVVAAAIWVVFGGVVLTILPKAYRLPSLGLLPLLVAGCNALSDLPITISKAPSSAATFARPDVRKAFSQWINARDERKSGDIYVVAAAGGGIRAAFLTASYLAAADDVTDGEFGRRLFVISGVSGGSLGAATYALFGDRSSPAPCDHAKGQPSVIGPRQRTMLCTLGEDFLSPAVATFLFPDVFRTFWVDPVFYRDRPWRDRGRTLEQAWTAAIDPLSVGAFTGRFMDYAQGAQPRPDGGASNINLVLNATAVQSGQRAVASTFTWPMLSAIDLMDAGYDTTNVSMVGAVHNSARFTYVSPAGAYFRIADTKLAGQVADGGYFDNSGGLSLLEILSELQNEPGVERIRVIVITNDGNEKTICDASDSKDVASEVQLTAPIATFFATRTARAELSKAQLHRMLARIQHVDSLCKQRAAPIYKQQREPFGSLIEVSLNNDLVADFLRGGNSIENCDAAGTPAMREKEVAVRVKEAPLGWTLSTTTTDWLTRYAHKEACKLHKRRPAGAPG